MKENENDLLTITQTAALYSCFSESSIRNHVFRSKTNGLHIAVIRIGRSVYIDKAKFDLWVRSNPPSYVRKEHE